MWRHKPNVKDDEKQKYKIKAIWYESLIYEHQRHDFIMKTLNSKI